MADDLRDELKKAMAEVRATSEKIALGGAAVTIVNLIKPSSGSPYPASDTVVAVSLLLAVIGSVTAGIGAIRWRFDEDPSEEEAALRRRLMIRSRLRNAAFGMLLVGVVLLVTPFLLRPFVTRVESAPSPSGAAQDGGGR